MRTDDDDDNIVFNSMVIVESLDDGDVKTGQLLRDYINGLSDGDAGDAIKASFVTVHSRAHFISIVNSLTEEAKTRGAIPILHIEAHGNEAQGIYFADDTNIEWNDLCDLITPLKHLDWLPAYGRGRGLLRTSPHQQRPFEQACALLRSAWSNLDH